MLKIEINGKKRQVEIYGTKEDVWYEAASGIATLIKNITEDAKDPKEEKQRFCEYLKSMVRFLLSTTDKEKAELVKEELKGKENTPAGKIGKLLLALLQVNMEDEAND